MPERRQDRPAANKFESTETTCTQARVGLASSAHMECSRGRESQQQIANTIHSSTDADHVSLGFDLGRLQEAAEMRRHTIDRSTTFRPFSSAIDNIKKIRSIDRSLGARRCVAKPCAPTSSSQPSRHISRK
jgi:hypothetical protein